jgi:hypothetical protein
MIGVLAILTMIAAVLTPGITQRLSRLRAVEDAAEVQAIGNALRESIKSRLEVPGLQTWPLRASAMLGISANEVRYSVPGESSTARVYLIHPSIQPATPTLSSALTDPVWSQGVDGADTVSDARVMILSVYRPGLPLPLSSGAAASASAFESLWSWYYDPATRAPPAGWPSAWNRNGHCLHIERIQLLSLFRKVTFSNVMSGTRNPFLKVGNAVVTTMGSSATHDALYLEGTVFRLYQANPGSGSPGSLQIVHSLRDSVNFVYENDRWAIQ